MLLYRYVYICDGEQYPVPYWYKADKSTIQDAKYNCECIKNIINGDSQISWFMEFKEVAKQ